MRSGDEAEGVWEKLRGTRWDPPAAGIRGRGAPPKGSTVMPDLNRQVMAVCRKTSRELRDGMGRCGRSAITTATHPSHHGWTSDCPPVYLPLTFHGHGIHPEPHHPRSQALCGSLPGSSGPRYDSRRRRESQFSNGLPEPLGQRNPGDRAGAYVERKVVRRDRGAVALGQLAGLYHFADSFGVGLRGFSGS